MFLTIECLFNAMQAFPPFFEPEAKAETIRAVKELTANTNALRDLMQPM
jgi:predicted component of type VI protein secretion system